MVASCGIDTSKLETRLFINNEFVNSKSGKTFETVDPATEEVICSVQEAGPEEVTAAVRKIQPVLRVVILVSFLPCISPLCWLSFALLGSTGGSRNGSLCLGFAMAYHGRQCSS